MGLRGDYLSATIYFVPGYEHTFGYQFVTNSGFAEDYELYTKMFDDDDPVDLTPYFVLDKTYVENVPSGAQVPFTVTIRFPQDLPTLAPGMHEVRAGARETENLGGGGGSFGIRTATEARFFVIILAEYPFAQVSFSAHNTNKDGQAKMVFSVQNWGKPELTVQGKVDIYDANGLYLGSVRTASASIASTETRSLEAFFDTTGLQPAAYLAKAELQYGDKTEMKESKFRIGKLDVNVDDYSKSFRSSSINKFILTVTSGWNDPIKDVHAQVSVGRDGETLRTFNTVTGSLQPWQTTEILGYFDTDGLETGSYDCSIGLYFDTGYKTESGQIEISEESTAELAEEKPNAQWLTVTNLLIIAIIFLILLIVIVTIKIFRK